ncbi:metalloregulator ArsR/SmtB family transcription factor [Candidatus Saccharibacteria bacterium]|nr:metalloregulator ArsR/SmtB family transcription factor [Candidatus Saccharibacteria bacterium]
MCPKEKGTESPDRTIFEYQAEVCKTLANPKRLEIIHALKGGEKSVSELVEILGIPKANVSQHLTVMKHKGVLNSRKDGVNVFYSIASPKVVKACTLMKEVLAEQMQVKGDLYKRIIG